MANVVVLTATITPPAGVPHLKRVDPAQRLGDYCKALAFYCQATKSDAERIVFAENSLSDLSALRKVADDEGALQRVEFVSFAGLDHPSSYGRGYGEFKLLDHVYDRSNTVATMAENDRIWKATGRYSVLNLQKLIATAPAEFDLYCDTRNWPIPWMDLRVFSCTRAGYKKYLFGVYEQLREDQINMSPEKYLYPLSEKWAADPRVVVRLTTEPRIDGIRGMDQQNYDEGKNRLKYWGRMMNRQFIKPLKAKLGLK
jgi:hypothetical protein